MKKILLYFIVTAVSLKLTESIIPGIEISNSTDGLLLVTIVFTIVNFTIKPLLKILSLPIEIATLGLFTIVINTVLLLFVDYLLVPLSIEGFWFPGIVYGPVIIAPTRVPAVLTALLGSVLISMISSTLLWLSD